MRETLITAAGHRTTPARTRDSRVVVEGYRSRSLARRARLETVPVPDAAPTAAGDGQLDDVQRAAS